MGHVLGLRHNFAGSLDRDNYPDAYFKLNGALPLPTYTDYDSPDKGGNGDRTVTGEEVENYQRDVRDTREKRLKSGAGTVMTASIMDYNGDMSDQAGLGRYDRAAVAYSYFDRIEAYEGNNPKLDPANAEANQSVDPTVLPERPDLYRRDLWSYYRGGEICLTDLDCPYAAGRSATSLQPVTQHCIANPRLQVTAGATCGPDGTCVCSNFFDDFDSQSARGTLGYSPVKYMFCHDNRTSDLSWCTRSDAGESFAEVLEHYRRSWRERYPRQYFRHFSANDPQQGGASDSIVDAVKIYQHLFFRDSYEGAEFSNNQGPLGLNDQYLASIASLDWLTEIIGSPDVGSYKFDPKENVYRQVSKNLDEPDSDVSLPVGQGYYLWSEYQTGQNGFFRLERAGTFTDKVLAIQALTRRDWGLKYQLDEFFYVNYYDLFEKEIVDLFGGLISRNPAQYAPRYRTDRDGDIEYLSSIRGENLGGPDRGNLEKSYPQPAIDGVDTETLRDIATIEALSEFPVYYDTSFEQRLLVFKLGSGDGYTIPDKRRDGTATCKYGDMNCASPNYIVYDSDRLHTSYVAVVINTDDTTTEINEQQVAYQLLRRLTDRQSTIRTLNAKTDRTADDNADLERLTSQLQRDESFLEYLIELERQLGISSYFF
jgi:hypothetical protein